jgi:hypothetical protein
MPSPSWPHASGWTVAADESRRALGERRQRRPHPASPEAAELARPAARLSPFETPVMFCVRVPSSLRQRVKLAAVRRGQTVQEFVIEVLESACPRHDE